MTVIANVIVKITTKTKVMKQFMIHSKHKVKQQSTLENTFQFTGLIIQFTQLLGMTGLQKVALDFA